MAAVNLKLGPKFNQMRKVNVGVYDVVNADIVGDGSTVATLAPGTAIVGVKVLASGTASTPKVTIKAGGSTLVNDQAIATTGVLTSTLLNLTNGGDVVLSGGVGSASGTFKFLVDYVEYDKTTGEYTPV